MPFPLPELDAFLASEGFDEKTRVLACAVVAGGRKVQDSRHLLDVRQEAKDDGSTVGALDIASGTAIAQYVNAHPLPDVQFRSEENMPFYRAASPRFGCIIDDVDGTVNEMIGGTNLHYLGVGGVIHDAQADDDQVVCVSYLPFADPDTLYVAVRGRGAFRVALSGKPASEKIVLGTEPAKVQSVMSWAFSSRESLLAEKALIESGFYDEVGLCSCDKVCAGIFEAVSGVKDRRQLVVNLTVGHQADYSYLLLEEAGAEVVGQDGGKMTSTSYGMLAILPSFRGDRAKLKAAFVAALASPTVGGRYLGWNPKKSKLSKVAVFN